MALVTFLSDFGLSDHYVAVVKAGILAVNPAIQIIDISHLVPPSNTIHGSYVLGQAYGAFPEGTVHLAAVGSHQGAKPDHLAMKLDGHYFVGPDNGLFSLISKSEPSSVVSLSSHLGGKGYGTFPARSLYAAAAAKLASGAELLDLGKVTTSYKRNINSTSRASKKQIQGGVVHIDHYGNLITNILKHDFDALHEARGYKVVFGRERIRKLQVHYGFVEPGECFAGFNDHGFLEIGINNGHAAELLGLYYDSPVSIIFE